MKPTTLSQKFGVPQSLVDYISQTMKEETEYQAKVKAHMAKKGIKSLGDLTPDEKKKFFNDLDAAHKAKNEEVEQTDEAIVKGKGYDNPENERKGPEGKVPMTSLMPGHSDKAARLAAVQAKGKLVKGKAQSAPQKEDYELTQEDLDFINSLNEKK